MKTAVRTLNNVSFIKKMTLILGVMVFGLVLFASSASAGPLDHFVITVNTSESFWGAGTEFELVAKSGTYDVDWDNDGTFDDIGLTGTTVHDFGAPGTYTIRIQGMTSVELGGGSDGYVTSINQWGTETWTTMNSMFRNTNGITITAPDNPDLSAVTDMTNIFERATSFNADLTGWNTSNVTTMTRAFYDADSTNPDISTWDTSNVVDMGFMFYGADAFNQPIGGWNTGSVMNMHRMFAGAQSFNQNIGTWNTANVTDMKSMFDGATAFNQNIGTWNTANVTDMETMFQDATSFNQPIGAWNTAAVARMGGMFRNATAFNQNIGTWNTGNVVIMNLMFNNATSFNQPIGGWDVSNVTQMGGMFRNATAFNQPIGGWNTGNVTTTVAMFQDAISFDQDLGGWDVTSLGYAATMFRNVTLSMSNYDSLLINWDAQALQNNVPFDGGNSTYCVPAAQAARANIIASNSWSITDGGLDPSCRTGVIINYEGEFTEKDENDGSVDGARIATITGDTFANPGSVLMLGEHYDIGNVPVGLEHRVTVSADGQSAILTFTGNAECHKSYCSIDNLKIGFMKAAFENTTDMNDVDGLNSKDGVITFIDNDPDLIIQGPRKETGNNKRSGDTTTSKSIKRVR